MDDGEGKKTKGAKTIHQPGKSASPHTAS